jgi:hypothetical protein
MPPVFEFEAAAISALTRKDTANLFLFPEQEAGDYTRFLAASFLPFRNRRPWLPITYDIRDKQFIRATGSPSRAMR